MVRKKLKSDGRIYGGKKVIRVDVTRRWSWFLLLEHLLNVRVYGGCAREVGCGKRFLGA